MTKQRQDDKSTEKGRNNVTKIRESTAEQTERIEETAIETSQGVARVGTDLLRQNVEILQTAMRAGLDMATGAMGRSTNQLGISGSEVQEATERTTRSAATILHSTTAAAEGVSRMSQEYFAFVHHQIERNMERMNKLWGCRSPQDVAAVQVEFFERRWRARCRAGGGWLTCRWKWPPQIKRIRTRNGTRPNGNDRIL